MAFFRCSNPGFHVARLELGDVAKSSFARALECTTSLTLAPCAGTNLYVDKAKLIWMDGKLVPWDDANVHVLTHTLHYGLGAFEGIRCYECKDGRSAIVKLAEHATRLFQSMHILGLNSPYTAAEIADACMETVRANELKECYIRPLMILGAGEMGLAATGNPVQFIWLRGPGARIWAPTVLRTASASERLRFSATTSTR